MSGEPTEADQSASDNEGARIFFGGCGALLFTLLALIWASYWAGIGMTIAVLAVGVIMFRWHRDVPVYARIGELSRAMNIGDWDHAAAMASELTASGHRRGVRFAQLIAAVLDALLAPSEADRAALAASIKAAAARDAGPVLREQMASWAALGLAIVDDARAEVAAASVIESSLSSAQDLARAHLANALMLERDESALAWYLGRHGQLLRRVSPVIGCALLRDLLRGLDAHEPTTRARASAIAEQVRIALIEKPRAPPLSLLGFVRSWVPVLGVLATVLLLTEWVHPAPSHLPLGIVSSALAVCMLLMAVLAFRRRRRRQSPAVAAYRRYAEGDDRAAIDKLRAMAAAGKTSDTSAAKIYFVSLALNLAQPELAMETHEQITTGGHATARDIRWLVAAALVAVDRRGEALDLLAGEALTAEESFLPDLLIALREGSRERAVRLANMTPSWSSWNVMVLAASVRVAYGNATDDDKAFVACESKQPDVRRYLERYVPELSGTTQPVA